MSTPTTSVVAVPAWHDRLFSPLAGLGAHLRRKFYRFLRELPDRYEPVDPEVLKRVPVPV